MQAFTSLTQNQKSGRKSQDINNRELEMTDYLLPECEMSKKKDKIELFHIRTELNELPFNFLSRTICDKGSFNTIQNVPQCHKPKLKQVQACLTVKLS